MTACHRYASVHTKKPPTPPTKPFALRFGIGGVHGMDVFGSVPFLCVASRNDDFVSLVPIS